MYYQKTGETAAISEIVRFRLYLIQLPPVACVDFYGTLLLGDGQPPYTMGLAGDKRRAKLVMSLLDPLCTAEEKIVLKTPTKYALNQITSKEQSQQQVHHQQLREHLDKVAQARLVAVFTEHRIQVPKVLKPFNTKKLKTGSVDHQLGSLCKQLSDLDKKHWTINALQIKTKCLAKAEGMEFCRQYDAKHPPPAPSPRTCLVHEHQSAHEQDLPPCATHLTRV